CWPTGPSPAGARLSALLEFRDSGAALDLGVLGRTKLRPRFLDEGAGAVPDRPHPPHRVPSDRDNMECHGSNSSLMPRRFCGSRALVDVPSSGPRLPSWRRLAITADGVGARDAVLGVVLDDDVEVRIDVRLGAPDSKPCPRGLGSDRVSQERDVTRALQERDLC